MGEVNDFVSQYAQKIYIFQEKYGALPCPCIPFTNLVELVLNKRCKSINHFYININVLYCKTYQVYDGCVWIGVQGN